MSFLMRPRSLRLGRPAAGRSGPGHDGGPAALGRARPRRL